MNQAATRDWNLRIGRWFAGCVIIIIAFLLLGGCSAEPSDPCQPLDPNAVSALIDRETAARESHAESVARMEELYEEAGGEAKVKIALYLRNPVRNSLNAGTTSELALEYAALPAICERELDEDYSEGLTQVVRVWDKVQQIRDEVQATEERAADAARRVRLAEVLVRLGEERKRMLEQEG